MSEMLMDYVDERSSTSGMDAKISERINENTALDVKVVAQLLEAGLEVFKNDQTNKNTSTRSSPRKPGPSPSFDSSNPIVKQQQTSTKADSMETVNVVSLTDSLNTFEAGKKWLEDLIVSRRTAPLVISKPAERAEITNSTTLAEVANTEQT
jgi:hypothetical protein